MPFDKLGTNGVWGLNVIVEDALCTLINLVALEHNDIWLNQYRSAEPVEARLSNKHPSTGSGLRY